MLKLNRSQQCRPLPRAASCALAMVLAVVGPQAGSAAVSENSEVEIRIKAAFIFNFARFIEWPPRPAPGPVRIAILGHGDLAAPLEEVIRGKLAGGKPVTVKHIGVATEAECCEILLIERSEFGHLRDIVQTLSGKPVLTVCDAANGLVDGVMIGFKVVDDSVRFQIDQGGAERAGLKISSQLLKVALPSTGKHL